MTKRVTFAVLALWLMTAGAGAQPPSPSVQPAIAGILAAFRTHALVGLGDAHNLAQEEDFYAALVRDPRFAPEVGNVVVEFGSAANQKIADRYLAGEAVAYSELRKVWTDSVGGVPGGVRLGYINFFATVRAVNLTLPADRRIRVLLGDPPIDWSKVRTKADWLPLLRQRDIHAAALIEREILAQHKKALVIYGGTHFFPPDDNGPLQTLGPLITQQHPGGLFVITPYEGFNEKSCSLGFEQDVRSWPAPALAVPVRGTSLEETLKAPGCHVVPPGSPPAAEDHFSGVAGDALLFMGPATGLGFSPIDPDIYLDADYRAEMSRRYEIIMGKPLAGGTVERNPAALLPFRP